MTWSPKVPCSSQAAESLLEVDTLRDEKCPKGPVQVVVSLSEAPPAGLPVLTNLSPGLGNPRLASADCTLCSGGRCLSRVKARLAFLAVSTPQTTAPSRCQSAKGPMATCSNCLHLPFTAWELTEQGTSKFASLPPSQAAFLSIPGPGPAQGEPAAP